MDKKQQAGKVLAQIAGYVGVRVINIGINSGLFEEIAKHSNGISSQALAEQLDLDPFYVQVWCRAAYASEILELETKQGREEYDPQRRQFADTGRQTYLLAPHMDELLLDQKSPAYVGGLPSLLLQPEIFDRFDQNLKSGEQLWWNECSHAFIQGVSNTGGPFYARLVPDGLERVPGLADVLEADVRIMELCCGAGRGLVKLGHAYPNARLVGVDGDAHSLGLAEERIGEAGLEDRISLVESPLEELEVKEPCDVVLINISMHECRDIQKVTQNVWRALKPGGHFVISDFPFPESTENCRTVPARIMSGIQFFEALIGDQLMPTRTFVEILEKRGFEGVGAFELAPVHAVTYGRKPA